MSWDAIAAFTALGFTVLTSVVVMMRGLAKIELNLRNYFEVKQVEMLRSVREDISESRNMFGETVKAAKEHANIAHEKIDDVIIRHQSLELYIRDNYVSIPAFEAALKRIESSIIGMDLKIDELMKRS